MGENTQKSKQPSKTFVSNGTQGEEVSGPVREQGEIIGVNSTNNSPIFAMLIFKGQLNPLIKPFLLFFYGNLRYITFYRTLYHVMEVHDFL